MLRFVRLTKLSIYNQIYLLCINSIYLVYRVDHLATRVILLNVVEINTQSLDDLCKIKDKLISLSHKKRHILKNQQKK